MIGFTSLPASPAEEHGLVAVIADAGATAISTAIGEGITPASFIDPNLGAIFAAAVRLHAEGLPTDAASLAQRLGDKVPIPVLAAATASPPLAYHVPSFCREIKKTEKLRSLIRHATAIAEAAAQDPERLEGHVGALLAAYAGAGRRAQGMPELVTAAKTRYADAVSGKPTDETRAISWGFSALDRLLRPIRRKELVILAGRPSTGKSSLDRQVGAGAAFRGQRVVMFSLEVGADDVIDGIATARSSISTLQLGSAHELDRRDYLHALDEIGKTDLHLFEDRTLAAILSRTQALHAEKPVDLVAVDYLGLIADTDPGKGELKASAIGRVTGALKRLAMELDCVVLCLAQLNRNSVNDGNREPGLHDLRDSGAIEQDADRVILLHRPDTCPITRMPQNVLDSVENLPRYGIALIQAKGRNVGTAMASIWFNRALARFEIGSAQ